jgi:magnesium transporter
MASNESLSLAFVSAHPAEAARILERLDPADTAALFKRLPARVSAPALSMMLPSFAARVIAGLDADSALSLLVNCGTQAAVRVLRQLAEPQRNQLVSGLPTTMAVSTRMLLRQPGDSVGAWIDPEIVLFAPEATVDDAIARIAAEPELQVELLFSVDRDQRLVGTVSPAELLRVTGATKLVSIARKPPVVLTASTTLTSLMRRRGWQQAAALPVVDAGERLIGVFHRGTLERVAASAQRSLPNNEQEIMVTVFARGYWNTFTALAEAAVSMLPRARSISAEKP